jgi:hypothetical protein
MGFDCRFDKTEIVNRLQSIEQEVSSVESKLQSLEQKIPNLNDYLEQKLLASVFNTSITANTNIFSQGIAPTRSPVIFRIYATFDASGVLSVVRTKGTTTVSELLNSGNPLNANAAHIFDIIVEQGETINFQYSVNATCLVLKVVETR